MVWLGVNSKLNVLNLPLLISWTTPFITATNARLSEHSMSHTLHSRYALKSVLRYELQVDRNSGAPLHSPQPGSNGSFVPVPGLEADWTSSYVPRVCLGMCQ
ncbi:uncharacterized protein B0H18DRAFT_985619 [Fomitopsis serialis]|uniref:uncharacterized protein n=1 Tax=Fomitopsis serialis TaxID=139415 RepID=UPI00200881F1|nr:uncharacterized protein B0H18DRAFT_985619 [Neoantrodia serialis]KAH9932460.1 hypothetical protein B0H18DRAFT_985619 [Neoantrodia serialis]